MIEKLTDDRNKARRGLESETTETLTSQIELEKLAEEFKRAHSDRQGTTIIDNHEILTVTPYFQHFCPQMHFFRHFYRNFSQFYYEIFIPNSMILQSSRSGYHTVYF